jgi:hypothetical protein
MDVVQHVGTDLRQERRRFDDAALFVWACWLVMVVSALTFVARYSRNIPYWDEFSMVGAVTHEQPVTLAWLWAQHNEHRIVLPRLVYLGLAALSDSDFRAGMFFSVGLMSLLAAGLVIGAKRIRGHYRYSDAFFPLVLLNLGHSENLLWSFQIAFALSTFLIGVILLLLVSRKAQPVQGDGTLPLGPVVLAGLCMVLLPLCGAQGTLMVPPLAIWLGWAGVRALVKYRLQAWRALPAVVLPLLACALIVCYFSTGYVAPKHHLPPPSIKAWLRTCVQFLAVGFGPAIRDCGEYGIWTLGVLSATVMGGLAVAWKRCPAERRPLTGMFLFFVGMLALAAALGKGRAFISDHAGYSSRYAWLAVPFSIGLYLAAARWGFRSSSRFVQTGLLLLAAVVFLANFREGHLYAKTRLQQNKAILAQVHASTAPEAISVEAGDHVFPSRDFLLENLRMMQRAKIGPYR